MDNFKDIIWRYLDKRFSIVNSTFYSKISQAKNYGYVYGSSIVDEMAKIFDIDHDTMLKLFKDWAYENGFQKSDEIFKLAYNPLRLKLRFSNEMVQDIAAMSSDDIEQQIVQRIITELSNEIDTTILTDIFEKNKKIDIKEFFSLLKCIGFDLATTIYDPNTFQPMRSFISTTYNDMINERQTNTYWKNWVRASRHIEKA